MTYISKKNHHHFFSAFLCTAITLIFSLSFTTGLLRADEKEDNPNLQKTETAAPTMVHEIVVQGEAVEKAATVTVVTSKDIEQQGASSVAEALEMIPGTHVRVGGKGEAYIRMRGFRQREVALLIDGVPISSPYDGQLDLSSLPVDAIERIDVVKGAASVMYGANAMGGVVNIITRKGGKNKSLTLNGGYGTGENVQLSSRLQGELKGIRYFLSGSYTNREYTHLSNDYESARNQDEGERLNSDRRLWSGRAGLDWNMGPRGKAGISFTHMDAARGLPHHESDNKAKYWRFSDWSEGILDTFYQGRFGLLSLQTRAFYQYFQNTLDSYDDMTYTTQEGKKAFSSSYKDYSLGGDVFLRLFEGKKHSWKTALRFHHDVHRSQDDAGDPWERFKVNFLSIPLEGEWQLLDKVTLIYGASLDMMFFNAESTGENKNKTALSPQVALMWSLGSQWSLKTSASLKTRFPNMKELFSSTSGNPELDPMRTAGFEAGIEFRPLPELGFSLVGFYNDVDDMIDRVKRNDPYINIDRAVFKGIEAEANWQWNAFSRAVLAYTWLKAEDKTGGGNKYIQHRPEHKLDMSLALRLPAKFNVFLNASFVSFQRYYDDDEELRLAPYTLVDLKLSRRFFERFEFHVTVRNLLDVNYYESEGFPLEGRMIYAGVGIEVF